MTRRRTEVIRPQVEVIFSVADEVHKLGLLVELLLSKVENKPADDFISRYVKNTL